MAMAFRRDLQAVVYFETDFCFACFWLVRRHVTPLRGCPQGGSRFAGGAKIVSDWLFDANLPAHSMHAVNARGTRAKGFVGGGGLGGGGTAFWVIDAAPLARRIT